MRSAIWAGLVAAGLVASVGCKQGQTPAPPVESAGGRVAMEHKTIQTAEKSPDDFRGLMAQWGREGWRVLSTSRVVTQADGTMTRTVQLARPKE